MDQGRRNTLREGHSSSTEHRALQRGLSPAVAPTKFSPGSITGKITKFLLWCLQLGNRATYGRCHENFRWSVQIMHEHTCLCTPTYMCMTSVYMHVIIATAWHYAWNIKNFFLHCILRRAPHEPGLKVRCRTEDSVRPRAFCNCAAMLQSRQR